MEVVIERLDYFGRGIAYIDNKICFIPNALPGEVVDVEIVGEHKKYNDGVVTNYISTSDKRIVSRCPYFNVCGGCQFQNMEYRSEVEYKSSKVKDLVSRIGHVYPDLVDDCISLEEDNYRNKVVFHVVDKELGYYQEKTNKLVSIDECLLLRSEINDIIPILRDIVKDNDNNIEEVMVRCSNESGKLMVCFLGDVSNYHDLDVECIYVNNELISGNPLISEIGECKFYVSPKSFFQVNSSVVSMLYDEVLNYCRINKPNNVLDLYCGTGTIGIYISKEVGNVFGIDYSESSIDDANKNKELNNSNNCNFVCSRVEDYIDKLTGEYDLVVVDPPRAGLDTKTIDYLKTINSNTIIYISCDPATLSRDINLLSSDYNVISIKPFNMFPRTYHCESVCLLSRKN